MGVISKHQGDTIFQVHPSHLTVCIRCCKMAFKTAWLSAIISRWNNSSVYFVAPFFFFSSSFCFVCHTAAAFMCQQGLNAFPCSHSVSDSSSHSFQGKWSSSCQTRRALNSKPRLRSPPLTVRWKLSRSNRKHGKDARWGRDLYTSSPPQPSSNTIKAFFYGFYLFIVVFFLMNPDVLIHAEGW